MQGNNVQIGCEIFIVKDNKLLLGKRKNCFGSGDWGLPGGHLEFGEKLVDCAIREIKEELDVDVKYSDIKMVVINDDNEREDVHYVHIGFRVDKYSGEIKNNEQDKCEEWRFFDTKNLPENIFIGHKVEIDRFLSNEFYKPY